MANTLGPRSYYRYTDDEGNNFKYLTDDTLAEAVGAVLDDLSPRIPTGYRKRVVFCQGLDNGNLVRKELTVPDPSSALYAANTSQTVIIGGTSFSTTGRRGEAVTFGSNIEAPTPPQN